jgi:CRISPR-associated endonuclease Csy4
MNYYLEIRLLPDPEFVPSLLLNVLYNKLHSALVKLNCGDLGISFPQYRQEKTDKRMHPLGTCIRIHVSDPPKTSTSSEKLSSYCNGI